MKFLYQLGMLLVVAGAGLLLTVLLASPGMALVERGFSSFGFHWMQWMQTLVLMISVPLCWYRWWFLSNEQLSQGKWRACLIEARMTTVNWRFLFVTFCLMLAALPMLDTLEVFMNRLPWPENIRNYIIEGFSRNQAMIGYLLSPTGFWATVEQFLLMCLFTAIGEELMFRGALFSCLRTLKSLNIHVIAWTIGFIFALIHFEPAGFVVRMLLGAVLVYLVHWSGSLWPSILAHCMNNSFALIGYHLATPEERSELVLDYTFGLIMTACSAFATVVVLYVLWQMRSEKEGKTVTESIKE